MTEYSKGYEKGWHSAMARIIRCRECKWYVPFPDGMDMCKALFMPTKSDDYCSHAERKDGE